MSRYVSDERLQHEAAESGPCCATCGAGLVRPFDASHAGRILVCPECDAVEEEIDEEPAEAAFPRRYHPATDDVSITNYTNDNDTL